jgi:hypothetical protein
MSSQVDKPGQIESLESLVALFKNTPTVALRAASSANGNGLLAVCVSALMRALFVLNLQIVHFVGKTERNPPVLWTHT